MNTKFVLGLTACLLAPILAGCTAAGPGIVRGQSPAEPHYQVSQPAMQATNVSYGGPGMSSGQMMPQEYMICPPTEQGRGYGMYPRHHHTYDYKAPQNLSYPPATQQAPVVQYPYYTVKGPSDFFMK